MLSLSFLALGALLASQCSAGSLLTKERRGVLNPVCSIVCPKPPVTSTVTSTLTQPPVTLTVTEGIATTATTTLTETSTETVTQCESTGPEPPKKTFPCIRDGYITNDFSVSQLDLKSAKQTELIKDVGVQTSASAFNPLDNYIYAVAGADVIRISSDGTHEKVASVPSVEYAFAADFAADGQLWIFLSESYAQVDLAPGSPTYGKVMAEGRTPQRNRVFEPNDVAYSPAFPGYLYGVAPDREVNALQRFSTETKTWETVFRDFGSKLPGRFFTEAAMATSDGILYVISYDTTEIYRLPIADPAQIKLAGKGVSLGGGGDGARCMLMPDA